MEIHTLGARRYGLIPGSDDVLLWLHGSTQSAAVTRRFTNRRFESLGMTVLYPEGVAHHWNDARRDLAERTRDLETDDVGFLTELVHSFEPRRVVGAGFSNGGHMIYRLLHDAPGLLDAAYVIAATQPAADNFLSTVDKWQPTPLLLLHGAADPIAPIAGGHVRGATLSAADTLAYYQRLNGDAAPIELVTLPDTGHVVPGPGCVASDFLGPANESVDAAVLLADFLAHNFP